MRGHEITINNRERYTESDPTKRKPTPFQQEMGERKKRVDEILERQRIKAEHKEVWE